VFHGLKTAKLEMDVSDVVDDGMEPLVRRVGPAVRAATGAACGAAVQVDVLGWSYPAGDLRRVGKALPIRWSVQVGLDTTVEAASRGQAALEAVLEGADVRLDELYKVYLLGVEAAQTIAPIVGLWGFTTVLEEAALKGEKQGSLLHLPRLINDLRNRGYSLPAAPSSRDPARIRVAALHPTPKDPAPTVEEVAWFRGICPRLSRRSRESCRATIPCRAKTQ